MNHTLNYSGFSDLFFNPDQEDASASDHPPRTLVRAGGQPTRYAGGDTPNLRCTPGLRQRTTDATS